MKGLAALFFAALQVLLVDQSDAVMCYSCDHVAHPRDCATVMECAVGESCDVMGYAQPDGHFYFKLGCRASTSCPASGVIGKKDIAICNLCCHNDYCNRKMCESAAQPKGVRCLKCGTVEHPSHCGAVTLCPEGQSCVTRQIDVFGEKRYSLGCAYSQGCIPTSAFRSALQRRSSQCKECCTEENCNRNLCKNSGTSSVTQPPPAVTAAPPVTMVTQTSAPFQTTRGPVVMTTQRPPGGGVGFCLYNGQKYQQDQNWVDGCKYNCTCIDASIGRLTCTDYCLIYTHIPSFCTLEKTPGECCSHPVCNGVQTGGTLVNFTSNVLINDCYYQGKSYKQDETWQDGCNFECECVDAKTGHHRCRSLCFTWTLPPACSLNPPAPGKCCKTPQCPPHYTISYPPGYVEN